MSSDTKAVKKAGGERNKVIEEGREKDKKGRENWREEEGKTEKINYGCGASPHSIFRVI